MASEAARVKRAYQRNDIVEHMSLTNSHTLQTRMTCIHNVHVKVICGRQTCASSAGRKEDVTYNNLADSGRRGAARSLASPNDSRRHSPLRVGWSAGGGCASD